MYIIGASLSEPHVVQSTAEISVVCLSVDVRSAETNLPLHGQNKFAASIRIRVWQSLHRQVKSFSYKSCIQLENHNG